MNLAHNDISEIPKEIHNLTALKTLVLDGNNLPDQQNMPDVLREMKVKIGILWYNFLQITVRLTDSDFLSINQVIPGLYISDSSTAKNKYVLKQMKITHILTVAQIPQPHPKVIFIKN